jgi:fumarate hydratase subunit alpha
VPITDAIIRVVTAKLYEASLRKVPEDTKEALRHAERTETADLGRKTLTVMLKSANAAESSGQFLCSDCGVPVYLVRIGTRVRIEGRIRQAITDGFADLVETIQPPILKMVTNPLTQQRSYQGRGMPIVTWDVIDDADYVEIVCSPKALGTGRWEAVETFVSPSLEKIENYVLDTVIRAGSQPCLPMVVGVGIGGTLDYAAKMAKEALLRPVGNINPEPVLADMERRLLSALNATGFGPMGTGGDNTAMAVSIDYCAGHGYTPVAVCINCWINRRTSARIYDSGEVVWD